jgi:hypothetical protein
MSVTSRWVTLEVESVEVRLEGSLIWWDPEAFRLDGTERQQVRPLLALVCDRKGVSGNTAARNDGAKRRWRGL